MPICKLHNVDIYYEVTGTGQPIVFTHGASWNHKQWKGQVEEFSKDFQTIVWDVRGHGYSTFPIGEFNAEDFTHDLIGLLDFLQIEKAILCGLSMGGLISLQTAIHFPNRVQSLILIGTPFTMQFNWFEKLFVPINRLSNRFIPMKVLAKLQAVALSKINPTSKLYIEETVRSMSHSHWLRIWNVVSKMETTNDLKNIHCPTLILYGDLDSMTKRQQLTLHATIQQSEIYEITNAHHATNLDNPTEVNHYMHRFIQKQA